MSTDLFPGFSNAWIDHAGNRFFARIGGPEDGPPLLLLHGFPQSHACWHRIAPSLASTHRVVCLDMKGYGHSSAPAGDDSHEAYSKRALAKESTSIMEKLGHKRFSVIGHDRGAQVAYRIALDMPEKVRHVAVLDNLPIFIVWELIKATPGFIDHWRWMARPAPEPETRLTPEYLEEMVRLHTGDATLNSFDGAALELYRESWRDKARVHAFCEDYRAGATTDLDADLADVAAGKTIVCPTLILWGRRVFGNAAESPVDSWRRSFAPNAFGIEVERGHFVMEESPSETLAGLRELLAQ